jgi:hypothetical protein
MAFNLFDPVEMFILSQFVSQDGIEDRVIAVIDEKYEKDGLYRQAWNLYQQGYTMVEIARHMDVNIKTFFKRLRVLGRRRANH